MTSDVHRTFKVITRRTTLSSFAAVSYYVTRRSTTSTPSPTSGHAYSTIAADILARHMRQRGEDVFFLTGTDEHGEPVAQAAEKLGLEPRELADRNAPRFKELMPKINASNDFFIRTTDPQHEAKVQEIVQRVHDNGHVYEGAYEGWYCPRCADFKTESELGEGNTCPIHKIPLEREREENWFFRLSTLPGAARAPLRRAPRLRAPRGPLQRGPVVHQGRAGGRVAVAAEADLGSAAALGPQPGDVRVVRRAAQLRHRAQLRARGRGPDRALLARRSTSSARTSSSSTPSTGPPS